jgi:hypothetical protein
MTTSWELTGVPESPGSRALIANLARRAVRAHAPLTITAIGAGGSCKLYVETDQHLPSTTRALRLTQVQAQLCEYAEEFDGARRQLARNLDAEIKRDHLIKKH